MFPFSIILLKVLADIGDEMYSFYMEYKNNDKLNLKVFIALNRCQQSAMKKSLKSIKKNNLTVSQFAVLEMLYHKGDLKIGEIIIKSLSTIGNISLVIDNLVKLSLVEKKKCEEDKRITYVSITEAGRKVIKKVFPDYLEDLEKIMEPLEEVEKKNLIDLLKKLGIANS